MKAIILVGGEGTRLRPLTYSIVKTMVPLVNRPFIEHVIYQLAQHNVKDIVLAMGYKPDSIIKYFGNRPLRGIDLTYSLEDTPLGTAGAVKLAAGHVDGTFFVLNGDVFTDIDYTAMLASHRQNKAKITIALTRVEDPTKFGVVETDEGGKVKRFIEKPRAEDVTSHWINAGVYILKPEVLEYIPAGPYMFERGVFPAALGKGERMFAFPSTAYWIDMGTPAMYHKLNIDMLYGRCSSPLHKTNPIAIAPTSRVDPSARLTAPILIGDGCQIGYNVQLKGPLVIGNNCIIQENACIDNSLLWDNITVGDAASITNSIIASGAKIEGKTRLDGETMNQYAPADAGGK